MPRENPNMTCVHCDGRLNITDSRPTQFKGKQAVRRRRRCSKCDWRTTTFEVLDTTLIDLDARLSAVRLTAQDAYTALGALLAVQGDLDEHADDEASCQMATK